MAGQSTKPVAGPAGAVTKCTPIALGGVDVFAVQAGIALEDALDAMALLLSTAEAAAGEAAIACGSDNDTQGAMWAVQHVLLLASGLNLAIHGGLMDAQRGKP